MGPMYKQINHVKAEGELAMGKKAPSDEDHLVTLCPFHHTGTQAGSNWEAANRHRLRKYLVLRLIEQSLKAGVLEEMKGWQPTEQGTPQGGVLSPLLAHIYLNPLDHQMAQAGYYLIRYADDFVILCRNRAEAQAALEKVRQWVAQAGLPLHPEKTRIVDATQRGGFEFLGWHFERGYQWPREKSQAKLRETIRQLTPRNSGHSLSQIIQDLNRRLQGWRGYFDHGVRNVHEDLEGMVRRRLRQILLKRRGKRGKPQGHINRRWPNA